MSKSKLNPNFELTINPATVRNLIERARAISAAISDEYEDGHEHEVHFDGYSKDAHHLSGSPED